MTEDGQLRFSREVRHALVASQHSPRVLEVLEFYADGTIVTPWCDGGDLAAYLARSNEQGRFIPLPRLVVLIADMCAGLEAIHLTATHRDVKLRNYLLDGQGRVKLADFGIAVALNDATLTSANHFPGTAPYMAPECWVPGRRVGKEADIHALGVCAYELLTGRLPFPGAAAELQATRRQLKPEPPSAQRADIPAAVDAVVLQALSNNPAQRQPSAAQFGEELVRALQAWAEDLGVSVPAGSASEIAAASLPEYLNQSAPVKYYRHLPPYAQQGLRLLGGLADRLALIGLQVGAAGIRVVAAGRLHGPTLLFRVRQVGAKVAAALILSSLALCAAAVLTAAAAILVPFVVLADGATLARARAAPAVAAAKKWTGPAWRRGRDSLGNGASGTIALALLGLLGAACVVGLVFEMSGAAVRATAPGWRPLLSTAATDVGSVKEGGTPLELGLGALACAALVAPQLALRNRRRLGRGVVTVALLVGLVLLGPPNPRPSEVRSITRQENVFNKHERALHRADTKRRAAERGITADQRERAHLYWKDFREGGPSRNQVHRWLAADRLAFSRLRRSLSAQQGAANVEAYSRAVERWLGRDRKRVRKFARSLNPR